MSLLAHPRGRNPVRAGGFARLLGLVSCLAVSSLALAAAVPRVDLAWSAAENAPLLSAGAATNTVVGLDVSSDLSDWTEIALTHDRLDPYSDWRAARTDAQFYRCLVRPRSAADDWKNQLWFLLDPMRSPQSFSGKPGVRWVKFAIPLDDPHRVYFQDSTRYRFHYDFAKVRLPGLTGISRSEFDAITLRSQGQEWVLGAVLFPPSPAIPEMGIQIAGLDPLPREQIAAWLKTVRSRISRSEEAGWFYFPTFEQMGMAQANLAWLAAQGIAVSSPDRWIVGDECYAPGWALGRMVFVPAAQIDEAFRSGQLTPEDILLTDFVPAEVPPLAGVITLTPATPNSHAAILAQSWGVPFVYLADPARREAVLDWDHRLVMLRAIDQFESCEVAVAPVEGTLPAGMLQEILALKQPPPLSINPKQPFGAGYRSAEDLVPGDINTVGGKAANFGLLRQSIPDHAPTPALAFTFDLWDAFLDQTVPGRGVLREAIATRLQGFTWPPAMGELQTALDEVRSWIRNEADFTPEQQADIVAALQAAGFDPDRKIRFRSSTNVEDAESFTGAGLYDSYSGCLADDLDGNTWGPSHCDPLESQERGVFRAMRRVYASFYNDNAYLERLRYGLPETEVGMAILVHPSTPDDIELANGVGTLRINRGSQRWVAAELVTQLGAVSVSNPGTTARPERVEVSSFGVFPELISQSSLVPLGSTVLDWRQDYVDLYTLLDTAAQAYEARFPAKTILTLDFEYKKIAPGSLRVKQIREIPQSDPWTTVPAYLLGTVNNLTVLQGEFGEVLALHRLKSQWDLVPRHTRLEPTHLKASLFDALRVSALDHTNRLSLEGPMSALPEYAFTPLPEATTDAWTLGTGAQRRRFELTVGTPTVRYAVEGPLLTLSDLSVHLTVRYSTPQPALGMNPRFTTVLEETVRLGYQPPPGTASLLQERRFATNGVALITRFYWPPQPTGVVAGYTAPLQAWVETEISGLTSQPLVLHDGSAQTYHPGHHNFSEEFVFDPWLEPSLDPALLEELAQQNIRALIVTTGLSLDNEFLIWGLDDHLRAL